MKKLLLTLLGSFIFSTISVFAEPVTVSIKTFTDVSGNLDGTISYTAEKGDGTADPTTNNGELRIYQASSGKSEGGFITITAGTGYKMTEVVLGSSMATTVKYSVDRGTEITDQSIAANEKLTVSGISANEVKFTCMGTDSKSRLYVNYLSVTYEAQAGTKYHADLKFEPAEGTVYLDDLSSYSQPVFTKATTADVTFVSDAPGIATVDQTTGLITPVAEGVATITATSVENDNYEAGTAKYKLSVIAVKPDGYKLQTSSNNLRDGLQFYIACTTFSTVMSAIQNTNNRGYVSATFTDGTYLPDTDSEAQLVTLEDAGDGNWYLKVSEGSYLYAISNNNYLKTGSDKTDDYKASIEVASDGVATIKFNTTTARYVKYNSSSKVFSCYTSGQQDVNIYADEKSVLTAPTDLGLYWPKDNYTVEYGQTFESPVLTKNPEDLTVNYTSSDDKVASIDGSGIVTIKGIGTTTITAKNEDGTYTAAYTLTVNPITTTLAWSANESTVTLGKEAEAVYPTLTVTPEGASTLVKYTSSVAAVATIDDKGIITPTGAGTTTITAMIKAYDYYAGTEASFTLTVHEAGYVELPTIELSADLLGLTGAYSLKSYTDPETNITFTTRAMKSNGIALQAGGGFLGITANPESYTIKTVSVTAKTTSALSPKLTVRRQSSAYSFGDANATELDGTIVHEQTYEKETDAAFNANIDDYFFAFNNSTSNGLITISSLVITVEKSTKQPANLSFGTAEYMVKSSEASTFAGQALTNANGLSPITYSSDNVDVATVNTDGKVTLTGTVGKAVISAAFEGNDDYNRGSASYTINVLNAANTLAGYIETAGNKDDRAIMDCELTVTYANGAYVYVTDGQNTAYSLIYKSNLGYKKGDIIPAGWTAKTDIYNGLFEIVPQTDMTAATKTATVGYETVDAIGVEYINKVVNLENVTFSEATQAGTTTDFTGTTGNTGYTFHNKFGITDVAAGTYNMTVAVDYFASGATTKDNPEAANLRILPIEYRLTADKVAEMQVSHASDKTNDASYATMSDDAYNCSSRHVFVKFVVPENHKVYYRFIISQPAAYANVVLLAEENETAFTEYTEPVEYNDNGILEYYTMNEAGICTEVKSVTFSGVTGIEDVVDDGDDAEAVYYNLQGVRVERPAKGNVYVRVAGSKAAKVLVK